MASSFLPLNLTAIIQRASWTGHIKSPAVCCIIIVRPFFNRAASKMLGVDLMLRDMEDPLQGHPRYEKIRWACCGKDNVQIALDRQRNKTVAIKFFPRGPAVSDYVRREILYHAELHHANVVALYHNLWQYVQANGGRLPEAEAQSLFLQLLDGVDYCHSKGVANRDIKLENCLINTRFHRGVRHAVLKICDFGYCKNIDKDSLPKSIVGTSAYLSLDILTQRASRGYNAMLVDLWSCGVVLYFLLEGRFPFGTEETNGSRDALFRRIVALEYDACGMASYGAQDLLSLIFCPPEMRIDLKHARDHWWVQAGYKRDDVKALRELHRQGSSSNVEMQTVTEMERLIDEACVPPYVEEHEWDDYFPL